MAFKYVKKMLQHKELSSQPNHQHNNRSLIKPGTYGKVGDASYFDPLLYRFQAPGLEIQRVHLQIKIWSHHFTFHLSIKRSCSPLNRYCLSKQKRR